jgi:hypothetical protein
MSTNDPQQQQMIREAMKSITERKPGRTKLVYDKTKRTIVAVTEGTQAPRALNITADDADMFAIATLSSRWLRDRWPAIKQDGAVAVTMSSWDNGDALTQSDLGVLPSPAVVGAAVLLGDGSRPPEGVHLHVVLQPAAGAKPDAATFAAPDGSWHRATGALIQNGNKEAVEVCFADVEPELATRRSGLLETNVLKDKTVLLIGVGTGGAHAAVELAKCGIGRFILVDRDRLSVGNVARHPGGISQVGRYKVNVIRDLIHEKNPGAVVATHAVALDYANRETVKQLVTEADVVICGTDNRPSKLLINHCASKPGWSPCTAAPFAGPTAGSCSGSGPDSHPVINASLPRCPRRPPMSRSPPRPMPKLSPTPISPSP